MHARLSFVAASDNDLGAGRGRGGLDSPARRRRRRRRRHSLPLRRAQQVSPARIGSVCGRRRGEGRGGEERVP